MATPTPLPRRRPRAAGPRWALAPFRTLKGRLAIGAGLMGLVAVLSGALTLYGMEGVSRRIEASLNSERRIARYSVLSTQISTFIVIAAEAVQAGLPPDQRAQRLDQISEGLTRTFAQIRSDLESAVAEAQAQGLDEQTRRATQSIAIARMEAQFKAAHAGLMRQGTDAIGAHAYMDAFSQAVDPLLNAAVTDEIRTRDAILAGIGDLKRRLTAMALGLAGLAALMFALFQFGLVRPQMARLDLARQAAQRIGREDFSVELSDTGADEIGRLFAETNRAARALAHRRDEVARDRARLNDLIAERTEELRAANEALARTDQDRRRFFADISHELRTPLTVILLEAELGSKGAGDPQVAFSTIQNRAQRLNRRIDDLLRVARSESGRIDLIARPVDLVATAGEALAEMRPALDSAGLRVAMPDLPPVRVTGDPDWLRQLIGGLIQNALRHARAGGTLALDIAELDGQGRLRVIDNGPGIPEADRASVFRRFQRGSSAPKAEGFGIGLALAAWLVQEMGGRIDLISPVPANARQGKAPGTMVEIRLPLVQE